MVSPRVSRANQDALVHVAVVHGQADADDAAVVDLLVVEGQREGGVAGDAGDRALVGAGGRHRRGGDGRG